MKKELKNAGRKKAELNAPFDESAEEETQTIIFFKGTDNELKPDLKILTPYDATVASEMLVCSTGGLKTPKILAQLVMTIKKQYQGIPVNAIINMVLSKCAQMITAKHIKYIEYSNIGYPNYYAIIFMPSGTGKDRMSDDLDKYVFFPHKLKLTELVNNNDKESMKREITSRELKALKISCLYACINHPNECLIEPEDMEMAIDTIERLSKDFSKFLNYRPKMTDRFDRLFQLFLDKRNKTFTKTELVNEHYQLSGYSRKYFRKNFDECIEIVEDIASQKGYILNKVSINNNSGFEYSLIPMKSEDLSDGIKNLKDLI